MRKIISLFILAAGLNAAAEQITYNCQTDEQKLVTISFDKAILNGATPKQTTVQFTVPNAHPISWNTSMFMVLPIKETNSTYVEFRHDGPWNLLTLEISTDLISATAGIQSKDNNIDFEDLSCREVL
jgi:hypothetical protein